MCALHVCPMFILCWVRYFTLKARVPFWGGSLASFQCSEHPRKGVQESVALSCSCLEIYSYIYVHIYIYIDFWHHTDETYVAPEHALHQVVLMAIQWECNKPINTKAPKHHSITLAKLLNTTRKCGARNASLRNPKSWSSYILSLHPHDFSLHAHDIHMKSNKFNPLV